ncbi:sensor domain-containing diguanylate cyclase [Herbaspirillum autotrophicum]|uniref:sensor domain-containing diguanylate cyclase n=1 Tax=Herbaspirillum autotrophicum TaxID=180195 RepID=UPI001E2D78DF|nr:sensor domain-containing diguanylate cyclase [Herbaspirillum autotrophicum]
MLAAMMFGLCSWVLYKSHDEARHYALETSQNLTLIAQRDIARNLEILSLSLDTLADRYQHSLLRQLSRDQRHSFLFGSTLGAQHIVVMAVLDAQGKVVVSSRQGAQLGKDYGDRAYFTVQRDTFDHGLYISKPINAKLDTDLQVLVLSKRMSSADGTFTGVVLMALDLNYFRDLFSGLALGSEGVMSLYSRDGVVYMRLPFAESVIGRDISKSSGFQQIAPLIQQDSGSFFLRGVNDGIRRLYAFREIPGTELVLFVGRSEQDIYRHWTEILYTIVSLMVLFSLVCLLLFRVLKKELRKRFEAEQKLHQLTRIDGLTGLLNRRALDDALRSIWSSCNRSSQGVFSILFIDVDHFKLYNDTYGHQKGDDALTAVATCFAGELPRNSDVAARYGGEEFIAVLGETDAPGALQVAEKIRRAIAEMALPHASSAHGIVTVSIGVATYNRQRYGDIDALLKAADAALYQAKGGGRNTIRQA